MNLLRQLTALQEAHQERHMEVIRVAQMNEREREVRRISRIPRASIDHWRCSSCWKGFSHGVVSRLTHSSCQRPHAPSELEPTNWRLSWRHSFFFSLDAACRHHREHCFKLYRSPSIWVRFGRVTWFAAQLVGKSINAWGRWNNHRHQQ